MSDGPATSWPLLLILGVLGTIVGSFLNVCMDRLPEGKSILSPRSHCPSCARTLGAGELIPVFSYLLLQGRCQSCGAAIPRRVLLVEIATGLLFLAAGLRFGLTPPLLPVLLFLCVFLIVFVVDLERHLILNVVLYPALAAALALSPLLLGLGWAGTALGAALGLGSLLLPYLLYPGGMGMGDVKFGLLLGLALGYPKVLVGLFLAFVSGGLIAVLLLALRRRGRKEAIPFGPFLAAGAMVALLWGDLLWQEYLSTL